MREIKFRMWDDEENIMIDGDSLAFEEYLPIKDLLSRDNIMQFTGMHDKNGKEIYEGDIVLIREGIAVITFYCGSFWCSFWTLLLLSDSGVEVEVIGNIYENPELLDTAKQDAERNP